jgi:hypothetical protein
MKQSVNETMKNKDMSDAEKIHDLIQLEKENIKGLEKLEKVDKGQWDMLMKHIIEAKNSLGGKNEQSNAD